MNRYCYVKDFLKLFLTKLEQTDKITAQPLEPCNTTKKAATLPSLPDPLPKYNSS